MPIIQIEVKSQLARYLLEDALELYKERIQKKGSTIVKREYSKLLRQLKDSIKLIDSEIKPTKVTDKL